ncbi:MAG: zinc ribbon domain-containing protein [Candidatus Lokiarchaeota archaeon]|nr:zinc ribbon domain-containing protein [Candidatus Harpocratesius repetitus]
MINLSINLNFISDKNTKDSIERDIKLYQIIRKLYIDVSTAYSKEILPILKHINAGFDDLLMGIEKEKTTLIQDSRKHFKRAGLESLELMLIEDRNKIQKVENFLKKMIIQDPIVLDFIRQSEEIRRKLHGEISHIREIKSDMTTNNSIYEIKYDEFLVLIKKVQKYHKDHDVFLEKYASNIEIATLKFSDMQEKHLNEIRKEQEKHRNEIKLLNEERKSINKRSFCGILVAIFFDIIVSCATDLIPFFIKLIIVPAILVSVLIYSQKENISKLRRIKCEYCGRKIFQKSDFCPFCGKERKIT